MKKRLFALLLAVMMIVAFVAACNNDSPATTPQPSGGGETATGDGGETTTGDGGETTTTGGEEVTLRVLNYMDLAAAGAQEAIELTWNAFSAAHPHITVERIDEFEEAYHQSVEAYAASGTLPDVLFAWPSGRSTTLHTQRLLKDLAPLVDRDGLRPFYNAAALDPNNQVGGYLAIIPQGMTATNAFYVNHEVLDAVGLQPAQSYSELVEQVPVLRAAGYDTILMPNLSDWVMQSCLYSLVIGRFMGEGWHERILDGSTNWEDPAVVASIAFIGQMYEDGVLPQSSLAVDYGEAPGLFATNTAAYYIDGDWRVGAFITDSNSGVALIDPERQNNFSITVFPTIDVDGVAIPSRTNSVVMGTGWGMNANIESGSAMEDAAWTLIKWLTGKDNQALMVRTGGLPNPSRNDIDFAALDLEPLQVAIGQIGSQFDTGTVVVDGAFEGPVYTPLNEGLQAVGFGRSTPEQVASLTQQAFEAWQASAD